MKILAFRVFIERVMDSNQINLRTRSKIDPYQKNEQNPSKSIDFEWISRFCAILCDFDRILPVFGTLLWIWVVEATQSRKNQDFET
jgi:hypothetical protein